MDKNKWISVGVVALVVLGIVLLAVFAGKGKTTNPLNTKTAVADYVATVNGVGIPRAEFNIQLALATTTLKGQGVDVENADKLSQVKTQVLNDLISNELVSQAIVKAGIKPTPEAVEAGFQDVLKQSGGAEGLKAGLLQANLTEAGLRENITKRLAAQTFLLQNIDTSSTTATTVEINQFYKDYSKAQPADTKVPALKDLSDQIKQQIIANKQQSLVNAFLETLRAKADVKISL